MFRGTKLNNMEKHIILKIYTLSGLVSKEADSEHEVTRHCPDTNIAHTSPTFKHFLIFCFILKCYFGNY